jgi:aspartyl/asparaginyl beta-hydroxylase (cupin superfamily)
MDALRRGDAVSAIEHFREATQQDPGAIVLWRNLATACRAAGSNEEERAALEAALDIDRTDFVAWLRMAQLHTRLNERGPAMAAWPAVMQLADSIYPISDELEQELRQGRHYLAQLQADFCEQIGASLDPNLDMLDASDARRARAFVDTALGRRRIYANQCAGLMYPFLPAHEFFEERHFPWFDKLSRAMPLVRNEALELMSKAPSCLRPYVQMDKGTPHNKWTVLDSSSTWSAAFLMEYGTANDEILTRCPATAQLLDDIPLAAIPGRGPTAFFSVLAPHTRIPAHTGVTNMRAIVHLPLVIPSGCGFRVGGETREWVEGQAFAFDDTIEHEAWNDSDQPRIVLIFDAWNPYLSMGERGVIARYYAAADASGLGPRNAAI